MTPIRNGDINGDGARDISDAVALLDWLFQGGPAPVACAQGGGLTAEQADILSHMNIVNLDDGEGGTAKTIRFSGVNVQIVNGLGATNGNPASPGTTGPAGISTNGLGNLIVGYQEVQAGVDDDRTGSHNIVVGMAHSYTSFGGLAVGRGNTISAAYCAVSGGSGNLAGADYASVSGGNNNAAVAYWSSISGGTGNSTQGSYATICGGEENRAGGNYSTVSGGQDNIASGMWATVSGGSGNEASSDRSHAP